MTGMVVVTLGILASAAEPCTAEVVDIGVRLEPFIDRSLIDRMDGTALRLGAPQPAETVLRFDRPWEGPYSGYSTIIHDDGHYHMYYRGRPDAGNDRDACQYTCYAASDDGVHWVRPDLGLYEIAGTRSNNVVLADLPPFSHNFTPFLDNRPGVRPDERFKAVAGLQDSGLVAFASGNGVHWRKLREEPIITTGAFDSQNVVFWSEIEQRYVCCLRVFSGGYRSVARSTSKDFLTWTEPVEMDFGDAPREHIYTNQTQPYYRAPHICVSIAARFMPGRRVISEETMASLGGDAQYSGDCSDAVLMTSRGGNRYDRTFMEGFVRPGIGAHNWTSRTNYPALGLVPCGATEMAIYLNRDYGQSTAHLQRFTLRPDGFASVNAPYAGGEMTTRALRFAGSALTLNYSTSAAGGIRVEVQRPDGSPLPGFALDDCDEIVGDELARQVTWNGSSDVSELEGTSIRLRFVMRDADLHALQFRQ